MTTHHRTEERAMSTTESYDNLLEAMLTDSWELAPRHPRDVIRYGQERATAREAVEAAAVDNPADIVRAIAVRRLVADAPVLAPIKMPKLSERVLNGKAVSRCVEAGEQAVIVHTPQGVRVITDLQEVAEDPTAVVLAQQAELVYLLDVDGLEPLDAARFIIDREARVIAGLQSAA